MLSFGSTGSPVSVSPAPSSLFFMCLFLVQSLRLQKCSQLHPTLRKDHTPCFAVELWLVVMSTCDTSTALRRMDACLSSSWLPCLWLSKHFPSLIRNPSGLTGLRHISVHRSTGFHQKQNCWCPQDPTGPGGTLTLPLDWIRRKTRQASQYLGVLRDQGSSHASG